jgi:hypothetical protein
MTSTIDFEQVLEIIDSSELEDIVILDETYEHLSEELPESDEKQKYVKLHNKTQERIKQLN